MAYNPYFPTNYQYGQAFNLPYGVQNPPTDGMIMQGQGNIQPTRNNAQNSILWVQGEAGAKAYPVAPNQTVQLWDSESQVIYLKSADGSGMPSMKILDYTIRDSQPAVSPVQKLDMSGYVTREEFEERIKELVKEHE